MNSRSTTIVQSKTTLPALSVKMLLSAKWPDPELSLGRQYKPLMDKLKRTKLCWGAQGPALDAYNEISDKIWELLNERDDLDEGADGSYPWGHTCCMVGRRREQARPTIVVHCRSKTCCRNIIDLIQETRWWKEFHEKYPAFGFIVAMSAPWPVRFGKELQQSSDDFYFVYMPENTDLLCGSSIFFGSAEVNSLEGCRRATLGGIILVGGIPHGLTVAHPCSKDFRPPDIENIRDLNHSFEEVDFLDDIEDVSDQDDEMTTITSRGGYMTLRYLITSSK
jgi:hypothetical protein